MRLASKVFIGHLGRAVSTVHSFSAQTSHERIECTKAKEQLSAYCLDIFILWNQAGESENGGRSCITYMMLPILFLNRNQIFIPSSHFTSFFNILNIERQKVYFVKLYVFISDFNKILAPYVLYMASRKRLLPPRTTAVMKSGLLSLKFHTLT